MYSNKELIFYIKSLSYYIQQNINNILNRINLICLSTLTKIYVKVFLHLE